MKKIILILAGLFLICSTAMANPVSDIPRDKAKSDIKNKLMADFPNEFTVIKYWLKENMKAYDILASIQDDDISDAIMKKQLDDFYPEFTVIKYWYDENLKAYKELQ